MDLEGEQCLECWTPLQKRRASYMPEGFTYYCSTCKHEYTTKEYMTIKQSYVDINDRVFDERGGPIEKSEEIDLTKIGQGSNLAESSEELLDLLKEGFSETGEIPLNFEKPVREI